MAGNFLRLGGAAVVRSPRLYLSSNDTSCGGRVKRDSKPRPKGLVMNRTTEMGWTDAEDKCGVPMILMRAFSPGVFDDAHTSH